MTDTAAATEQFFQRYASALLARDEQALATMYSVPSLILFPGRSIAVTDAAQTAEFFASAWDQYEGVDEANPQLRIMGEGPGTVWADVTWSYDGEPREHFCYQLIESDGEYRIVVLTLLG